MIVLLYLLFIYCWILKNGRTKKKVNRFFWRPIDVIQFVQKNSARSFLPDGKMFWKKRMRRRKERAAPSFVFRVANGLLICSSIESHCINEVSRCAASSGLLQLLDVSFDRPRFPSTKTSDLFEFCLSIDRSFHDFPFLRLSIVFVVGAYFPRPNSKVWRTFE